MVAQLAQRQQRAWPQAARCVREVRRRRAVASVTIVASVITISLHPGRTITHAFYLVRRTFTASASNAAFAEEPSMDLVFIGVFIAFFAASAGLIRFCASLMSKEPS
jgi:hypothetical protein